MYYQWREQQQPAEGQLQVQVKMKQGEQPQWLDPEPLDIKKQSKKKLNNHPSPDDKNKQFMEELQIDLQKSKKGLKKNIMNKIFTKIHDIQYNVFVSQTTDNKIDYLDKLYQHNTPNRFIKDQINETVMQTNNLIQKGIHKNQIKLNQKKIPKSKQQLQALENQDHYRLLQIKQGQMKHKIGHLRKQLQNETIKAKLKRKINQIDDETFQRNYYSIDHPKTKEATSFIRQVQNKSKQFQQQLYQSKAIQYEKKRRNEQQLRHEKQMQIQQRKTKLKEYYDNRLMHKMQQKERQRQKKQQFQEWIKEYQRQKPLQLQKQEQYRMKYIIPQLQQRHKKLMTIRAEHRPIDMDQIINHEQKYLQIKKDNTIRKRAQLQLKKQENDMNKDQIDNRLYKGKYRFLVLEQMIQQKYPIPYKQIEQSKKDRIKAYNQHLRSVHQDAYQQHRHKAEAETVNHQKFIRRVRKMNGSMNITSQKDQRDAQLLLSQRGERKIVEENTYQQGIKNLNYVKNKVRQQIVKEVQQPTIINLIEENQYQKPKGFIQQQRKFKGKQKQKEIVSQISKNIQKTSVVTNEQIGDMNAKLDFLDQRLRRDQMKLKAVDGANLQQGQKIESDYVNAIKAKIHMLQQFK